jgi:uncharacterized membrane protein YfcA
MITLEASDFVTIAAVFLLAGTVKGVIGLGLPTISLAILTVVMDLTSAMAILLIPSFVTNFWQAIVGGYGIKLIKQLWPFLLTATFMVPAGGLALMTIDSFWLSKFLGLLIVAYAGTSLLGLRLDLNHQNQIWAGPTLGILNGIFTGMTGSFVVPGVLYLNAIGLPRNALVQAMGMLFTLATIALSLTLGASSFLTAEMGWASLIGLAPAMLGMIIGRKVRDKLSEAAFRKIFFYALAVLGLYISVFV